MRKQKIVEVDYMRGFAFLAVVLQHAIGHYTFAPQINLADGVMLGFLLLSAKFAVPLFLYITGLVLFYNYEEKVSYGTFIRKRCRDILLPYVLWAVLYELIAGSGSFTSWEGGSQLFLAVFTGTASYHLWYVVMLAQWYLIFPPLQRLGNRVRRMSGAGMAIELLLLGGLYMALMWLKGPIYEAAEQAGIPLLSPWLSTYMDRNGLFFFFYFALGAAAGLHMARWRAWLVRYRFILIGTYAALLAYMLYRVVAHFPREPKLVIQYNDTFLLQPLMAVFLVISLLAMHALIICFAEKAHAAGQKWIALCGSYSYTAYLAHALVLTGVVGIIDMLWPTGSVTVRTLLGFLACAACSVLVAYWLRRIHRWINNRLHSGRA